MHFYFTQNSKVESLNQQHGRGESLLRLVSKYFDRNSLRRGSRGKTSEGGLSGGGSDGGGRLCACSGPV